MIEGTGTLVGIARRESKFAPMEELRRAEVSLEDGVANDSRGRRRENASNDRQVTVISAGAWRAACAELGAEAPWTLRRANLLVDGIDLERSTGARLTIGEVELEVT
ncbi:MAG: MOSC domain-containing protein, partial [Alphaproteobacteria bacterium]